MKISIKLIVLSIILSVLTLLTLPSAVRADDGNPPNVEINHLSDGTSLLQDNAYGYRFITPIGWYPISLPSLPEEIDKFNQIVENNKLPIDKDWVNSFPSDKLRFLVVDLNPEHYSSNGGGLIAAPFTGVTNLVPSGVIAPIIGLIRLSGMVTSSNILKISDQDVGVVEFASSEESESFVSGKLLLFIRKGKLFAIAGVSNEPENVTETTATIDQIIDSLEFFDVAQ